MKISRYQRMGPDLYTEGGTYANPFLTFDPAKYRYRQPAVPLLIRGRHPYRRQPRRVSPVGVSSGYFEDRPGWGLGAEQEGFFSTSTGKLVRVVGLVSVVGLLLYYAGKDSAGSRTRNTSRRRRRGRSSGFRKRMRRIARQRARDTKGRFV